MKALEIYLIEETLKLLESDCIIPIDIRKIDVLLEDKTVMIVSKIQLSI
jgi:hypothetical protein